MAPSCIVEFNNSIGWNFKSFLNHKIVNSLGNLYFVATVVCCPVHIHCKQIFAFDKDMYVLQISWFLLTKRSVYSVRIFRA